MLLIKQNSRSITTSRGGASPVVARPFTAIRGAGYTSTRLTTNGQTYDPLNQSTKITTPFAEQKSVDPYV